MYIYLLYCRKYKTFRFPSVRSANNFMNHNKGWGMLGYNKKWIHVARCDDKGY